MTAESSEVDYRSSSRAREIALWLAIACILLAGIGFSWRPTALAHALAAIFIACAIVHACFAYGAREGGADFGVPLTNYLGWLLTSLLVFLAFAFYLRRRLPGSAQQPPPSRKLQAIALLFYLSLGVTHVVAWAAGASGEVMDAAGRTWQVGDLRGTTVSIMLFTMVFTGLLAALRLIKNDRPGPH